MWWKREEKPRKAEIRRENRLKNWIVISMKSSNINNLIKIKWCFLTIKKSKRKS
jgi:hypothetical protein